MIKKYYYKTIINNIFSKYKNLSFIKRLSKNHLSTSVNNRKEENKILNLNNASINYKFLSYRKESEHLLLILTNLLISNEKLSQTKEINESKFI